MALCEFPNLNNLQIRILAESRYNDIPKLESTEVLACFDRIRKRGYSAKLKISEFQRWANKPEEGSGRCPKNMQTRGWMSIISQMDGNFVIWTWNRDGF